jgi:hypothetical protein
MILYIKGRVCPSGHEVTDGNSPWLFCQIGHTLRQAPKVRDGGRVNPDLSRRLDRQMEPPRAYGPG